MVVERVVRRRDHCHPHGAGAGGVLSERDRLGGGLRAAVDDDRQRPVEEELGCPSALGCGEQDPLAGRAQREDSVEPAGLEKLEVRPEGLLVQSGSLVAERRDGSRERSAQHATTLRSAAMAALRVEQAGDTLRMTMDRADRRNAFDADLIRELTEAFSAVGDARAVILAGEGESFSAGADVDWMRASIQLSYEENVADARRLRMMLDAINTCAVPVIARVQGHALGGGCGLVACSDVAVAAPNAIFAFSEVKLGIIPSVISPFALAKIGESAARRYFVTGERFDAATAFRIGLVHEVAEDIDAAVERIVAELRTAGPEAGRHAKQLVLERPDALGTERRIAQRRTSDEGQEGLLAFLEKRPPSWTA